MANIDNTIKETSELNNKILDAIHLFRLNFDLRVLNEELEKNQKETVSSKSNIFEKAAKNIKNEIKSNKSEKLQKNLDETTKLLSDLGNKDISYDELLEMTSKGFKDNISKLLFSISLVLEEKEYFYDEQSESTISMMLWEDVAYLENLKKDFKANYIKISSTNITSNKTILLGASACASFVTSLSSNPTFLDNLAVSNVKNDASNTIATLVALSLTKDTLYSEMKTINKEQLKTDFTKLSLEEVSYVYSVKSILIDFILNTNKTAFKDYLTDILSLTNDLKAVCLTNALVNKTNIESNEKLIDAFYRFEKDLLKKHCS